MQAPESETMRVLLVGSAASTHIYRWAGALVARGLHVHLVTAEPPQFDFPCTVTVVADQTGALGKLASLRRGVRKVREIFSDAGCDIVHCHYAGRYGAWGALSGVHPMILSVWGSDILLNPGKSALHKAAIGWMLKRADYRQSTSRNMADAAKALYGLDDFVLVPFGIDTSSFSDVPRKPDGVLKIVSVKSLRHVYGLDVLIKALARVKDVAGLPRVTCAIYGEGDDEDRLKALARSLGLEGAVSFGGRAPHADIPEILASHDVAVYPSRSESFGVSALEAMACGCVVILSDAPGHVEITQGLPNARIVARESVEDLQRHIVDLALAYPHLNTERRDGVAHVKQHYEWDACVAAQIANYRRVIGRRSLP
jgi:L-malate glycosyltransferase